MCGTGSILLETYLKEKSAKIIGGDISEEAVELATQKLTRLPVSIQNWDAKNLPLEDNSVDCLICNLPFGKQYSSADENKSLYLLLLKNWLLKLKVDGRMILLTSDVQNIENTCTKLNLQFKKMEKVRILGHWAQIYRISK